MPELLYNGKIYLGARNFAEALLIENGRIVKTGLSRDLLEEVPSKTKKTDMEGLLVLPAFYDSHLHLMWIGRRAGGIECAGARSIDEIIKRGRETIARIKPKPGSYVNGAGVNPDLFANGERRDLKREDLDRISTEFPVILSRHCGHTIYGNSLALKMAGFSESAPELAGGTIEKDGNGRPTGVFKENANSLLRKPMPSVSPLELKDHIRLAMEKAHSLGISACGSYDSGGADFERIIGAYLAVYSEFRDKGKPGLRVTMQCGISLRDDILDTHLNRLKEISIKNKALGTELLSLWHDARWGNFLKAGSVKLFSDGTLGGHTAWMRKPYRDNPATCGFPLMEQEKLEYFVRKAASAGMQVLIHAIGDAGIDAALKAHEKVTAPGHNPLRHGIIHCQVTSMDLLERIAKNRILALVQPAFLAEDRHIIENRVGEELASTSYAWGSMHKLGIPVSYGTDAPVSPPDPLFSMEWAMLRRDSNDSASKSFYPGENTDIYSAMEAYTTGAAYANSDESCLGRIAPGYMADLVFLDRDIFSLPPCDIRRARVIKTLCAGEVVYSV